MMIAPLSSPSALLPSHWQAAVGHQSLLPDYNPERGEINDESNANVVTFDLKSLITLLFSFLFSK